MTVTAFPKTKTVKADVIVASGALGIGCRREKGEIVPALSPLNTMARRTVTPVGMAEFSGATNKFWFYDGTRLYCPEETKIGNGAMLTASVPFLIDERENGNAQTRIIGDARCVVAVAGASSQGTKIYSSQVRGGIMKSGRLFAVDSTDGLKLKWSGEGGSTDWAEGISGAGWMYLGGTEGNVLELKELNGNIVAVRERGLTVISAFGNPENFKVLNVNAQTPQICFRTARVAGAKLYFCAEGSVYSFDGARVAKVENSLDGEILTPTYAAVLNGIYYYCGESKTLKRKVIAALDIADGECYIIDFPAEGVAAGSVLCAISQSACCFPKSGGAFTFESGEINFDTPHPKTLKRIEISGGGAYDVDVLSDGNKRSFFKVKQRLTVNMLGVNFKICVRGSGKISAINAFGEIRDGI